jgi:hypothetical protein
MTTVFASFFVLFVVAALLGWALSMKPSPPVVVRTPTILFVRAGCGLMVVEGELTMFQIPNDKNLQVSIKPVDAYGVPAKVDGIPVWAVADPATAGIQVADDGMSALLVPSVPLLDGGQLIVEADADMGDGIKTLTGTLEFSVVASEAVGLGIAIGDFIPK